MLPSLSAGQTTQRHFVWPALPNSRDISQATRSARQQIYFQRLSFNLHIHKMSSLYFALASCLGNGQRHPLLSMTLCLHCSWRDYSKQGEHLPSQHTARRTSNFCSFCILRFLGKFPPKSSAQSCIFQALRDIHTQKKTPKPTQTRAQQRALSLFQ